MSLSWDPRVVPARLVELLGRVQGAVPSRVAGGAALSGVHLRHRLSRDVDLFFDEQQLVRQAATQMPALAAAVGAGFRTVRDGGAFVRGILEFPDARVDVDLVHEPSTQLAPRDLVDGLAVESFLDLRANKLTCLLSRSEPRDLVDIYFLERAGYRPENDLEPALQKDAGIDPGILAQLLASFPLEPLPMMLVQLTSSELATYRDALAERFRRLALAPGE
jgi:hypothetical protein